jgi:hypothetical protein
VIFLFVCFTVLGWLLGVSERPPRRSLLERAKADSSLLSTEDAAGRSFHHDVTRRGEEVR